jgi:hypothetical protein
MIGEIYRVDYDIINDQLPLFYDSTLDGALVLIIERQINNTYSYVLNAGCLYSICNEYLSYATKI